ncbi:UDP-glucuronosyltransferase 2A2-like [Oppia nitens]|uniref:UDP-glucuronosyltransferase 2A2-like n=1 Tax=Oppia nitens TaxID=1686743 RepID=UPI0023DBFA47|nr:UDP-glucuronosyltransferase 2A2-like [Oppia nitens]
MIDAVGHVNSAIGIGQQLASAGHKVSFLITSQWAPIIESYGFQVIQYSIRANNNNNNVDEDPGKIWAQVCIDEGYFTDRSPLDKMISVKTMRMKAWFDDLKLMDPIIKRIINDDDDDQQRPDCIVLDHFHTVPSVVASGIPWVWISSVSPLFLFDDNRVPPPGSGLSSLISDKSEWSAFRTAINDSTSDLWHQFNNYCLAQGCNESLPEYQYFYPSPYLNLYVYPRELNYQEYRPLPENYRGLDNFMRHELTTVDKQQFEIPEPLSDKPGKLIYFSLGSMGAINLVIMKRLISILAKSAHRFIVAKGLLHREFDLPDNMWGLSTVSQIQVLPIVDLVITHGGNNTVAETMYFGKPMIVLPMFLDQYDNAQRLADQGLGLRLDVYNCTEWQLLTAIENVLNNREMQRKLLKISQRIQTDNTIKDIPLLFEKSY